ncbi:MAG: ribosome-associated translation inhibitor RaiA [Erysipelotrichaceae bacterium]|nr:ribosome-associated translation inhibitor RaiA [Erysipelotrichaceae bacterium]
MRCQIVGKNIAITDAMKRKVEEKLSKMDKYFVINEDVVAKVLARTYKTMQKVEITINTKMMDFRVEVTAKDFYEAVDLALDKLEGQMRKLKTKLCRRHKESLGESIAFENIINEEDDENDEMVRVKEVYLKPMDIEEAITRMEALGHSFFLYRDVDDDLISVVYKRFDGGYGVIQGRE